MGFRHVFTLPFPPSTNTYYRNITIKGRPRTLISAKGRAYRKAVIALIPRPLDLEGFLQVGVGLYPPDKRRRDIDNYLKGLLDALTHAGVWADDSQIKELNVTMAQPGATSGVAVTIRNI